MRSRFVLIGTVIVLSFVGVGWGTLSAAAVPTDSPTPLPTSGTSQIGFTVVDTASPTPSSSPGGGGSGGGHGGSGGSGGSSGGGTPATCVPGTKAPSLGTAAPTSVKATTLRVTPETAAQGKNVLVQGNGFVPGEKVVIGMFSPVVSLGTYTVRTNGQIYAEVTIPKRTQLGPHVLLALGFQDCRAGVAKIDIVSPHGSGSSPFPWIVWVLAGSAVGIAGIAVLVAFLLGWLPLGAAAATATTGAVATRGTP